jgi:hypothetical protein
MSSFGQLGELRAALPEANVMQIGTARIALLREIAREAGHPQPPPVPTPRLTLVALALAGIVCVVLLLLIVGLLPRPH